MNRNCVKIKETAMGTHVAPSIANICFENIEKKNYKYIYIKTTSLGH